VSDSVTRERIAAWLGPDLRTTSVVVLRSEWDDLAYRTELLCRRAQVGYHFVWEEPESAKEVRIVFAKRRIE
jgi:hypothetical protein